jgi:hypothetical protein
MLDIVIFIQNKRKVSRGYIRLPTAQLASKKILGERCWLKAVRHCKATTRLRSMRVEPRVSASYRLFALNQRFSARIFHCSLVWGRCGGSHWLFLQPPHGG